LLFTVLLLPALAPVVQAVDFTAFESGHVRPLVLSADGSTLYAVNTSDNRLEILDVSGARPLVVGSVPVGLEPLAVALVNDGEVWVVNHLSDSISIVDLDSQPLGVARPFLVADEPRDIVFASGR
jgi:DNA-binding beta-propeller fold protein YncE